MALDESLLHRGALYRYDRDGTLHTEAHGSRVSNGIGWSARTGGACTTSTRRPTGSTSIDFDPDAGALHDRRPFVTIPEARRRAGRARGRRRGRRVGGAVRGLARPPLPPGRRARRRGRAAGEGDVVLLRRQHAVHHDCRTRRRGLFVADAGFSGPPAQPFRGQRRRLRTPSRRARGSGRRRRSRAGAQAAARRRSRVCELVVGDLQRERRRRRCRSRSMSPSRTSGERAAARRLRGDVADHQPARRAGEAAVGDERDRLAEPGADDRRGDAQHLAHPRAAGRALVAHDEHVARLRQARAHRVARTPLRCRRPAPGRDGVARAVRRETSRRCRRARGCRTARRARRRLERRGRSARSPRRPVPARRSAPPRASRPRPSARAPSTWPARDELARATRACRRRGAGPRRRTSRTARGCAITGVRLRRSRRARAGRAGRPASRAIASRCRMPLVEPPVAAMPAIALSSARRSRNVRARRQRVAQRDAAPARAAAAAFASVSSAGISPSPEDRDAEAVERDRHRVGGELAGAGARRPGTRCARARRARRAT